MNHDVIGMEDFCAEPDFPLDVCLERLRSCDLYIGILARRYGYIPSVSNPGRLSITELEYRAAAASGKNCLIFLLKAGNQVPWNAALSDPQPDRINKFRVELEERHTCSFFKTPDDLASEIVVAVARLERTMASRPDPAISRNQADGKRLPSKFIAATAGLIQYLGARDSRRKLLERFRAQGLVSSVAGPDFKVQILQRGVTPGDAVASERILVIAGRAGVGKTTYVGQMLKQLVDKLDLVVVLRAGRIGGATRAEVEKSIEFEMLEFLEQELVSDRQLAPAAVSYALKHKRVLFIVEDLHPSKTPDF